MPPTTATVFTSLGPVLLIDGYIGQVIDGGSIHVPRGNSQERQPELPRLSQHLVRSVFAPAQPQRHQVSQQTIHNHQ
jgi:hypothetical protein